MCVVCACVCAQACLCVGLGDGASSHSKKEGACKIAHLHILNIKTNSTGSFIICESSRADVNLMQTLGIYHRSQT